jgi:hypothetical protein
MYITEQQTARPHRSANATRARVIFSMPYKKIIIEEAVFNTA